MKPAELAQALRKIADKIDASKRPHASAVEAELRTIMAAMPREAYIGRHVRFRDKYLRDFFAEKDIRPMTFHVKDNEGVPHSIPNEVVVEHIAIAPRHEQEAIKKMLRKLDFHNADINHYLKHLAEAIAKMSTGKFAGKTADLRLGKKDQAVIGAFLDRKPLEGLKLSTDGKRLDGLWMGGGNLASWKGSKIDLPDTGSRSGQTVQNAIRKRAPRAVIGN